MALSCSASWTALISHITLLLDKLLGYFFGVYIFCLVSFRSQHYLGAKKSYSSSGPVRYIPGRFAQMGNTQSCRSLQGSANMEAPISGNPTSGLANFDGRRLQSSHFLDEMSSPNNIFDQIGRCSGIEKYNGPVPGLYDSDYENTDEQNKISKANGDGFRKFREEIEEVAVGLLVARAMNAIELRKKLRGKKYPSDIIEFIVSDFKSRLTSERSEPN